MRALKADARCRVGAGLPPSSSNRSCRFLASGSPVRIPIESGQNFKFVTRPFWLHSASSTGFHVPPLDPVWAGGNLARKPIEVITPLNETGRRDFLEILYDLYDKRSTMIAAQLPPEHWHEAIGEPTLADAILDRHVHNAYHLKVEGESMRKALGLKATGTLDNA